MRQNSRSAIIYILFGILIAAFVISFGPGSAPRLTRRYETVSWNAAGSAAAFVALA